MTKNPGKDQSGEKDVLVLRSCAFNKAILKNNVSSQDWTLQWWCHCLLLHYQSSSFVISQGGGGCQSLMTSYVAAASSTCHHQSGAPAAHHHQSAQCGILSMSSVSVCMLLWSNPLVLCGPCVSDADWKWLSTASKQTNNMLHTKTLSCVSSTSYAAKTEHRPNRFCPQKHFNEIRLPQRWIQAEMVLNYLSEQSGEVCFMKTSWAKKNWNKERAKKLNNTSSMLWFKAVLNS